MLVLAIETDTGLSGRLVERVGRFLVWHCGVSQFESETEFPVPRRAADGKCGSKSGSSRFFLPFFPLSW